LHFVVGELRHRFPGREEFYRAQEHVLKKR